MERIMAKRNIDGIVAAIAVAVVAGILVVANPASANVEPAVELAGSEDGQFVDEDHIVVETFTITGEHVSTKAYSLDDEEIPVPDGFQSQGSVALTGEALAAAELLNSQSGGELTALGGGHGGSSSSSGCIRVTVRNEKESDILGETVFWFNTWTRWCWNRAAKTISDVSTGWYLEDVDIIYQWRGLIFDSTEFYSWYSGYPTSGYRHEKQGHFEWCITQLGCIGNVYPRNVLWSHSNGTWSWYTSD